MTSDFWTLSVNWKGGTEPKGRRGDLCNPPSRAVGKMKRGAFKFTACSRYLMVGRRGGVWKPVRVFCQFVADVVSYKTIFPDLFYSFRKNKIRNSNCLRVYYFRCARVGSRHSWISAANIPIQEYWLLVLFRDGFNWLVKSETRNWIVRALSDLHRSKIIDNCFIKGRNGEYSFKFFYITMI